MPYSPAFFELQLRFGQALATRFGLPLGEVLLEYTTLPLSLGQGDEWRAYIAGLAEAEDPVAWTYAFYLPRSGGGPTPADTYFHGYPLFGCFYYAVRDEHIIRPHLIKRDPPEDGLLSRENLIQRRQEMGRMFGHIRESVPLADEVLGNSWLYNIEAYRRLFPPTYTHNMAVSEEGEFRYLARWGQFFDRHWQIREPLAHELLDRVASLGSLEDLRDCFPYQILQPRCSIQEFYAFYEIDTGEDINGSG